MIIPFDCFWYTRRRFPTTDSCNCHDLTQTWADSGVFQQRRQSDFRLDQPVEIASEKSESLPVELRSLDSCQDREDVVRVKRRFIGGLICTLYASVAILFAVLHEHHHETAQTDGHDDDCAACQWQACATTDVPVCDVAVVGQVVISRPLVLPTSSPVNTPFFSPTASRAPPESLV